MRPATHTRPPLSGGQTFVIGAAVMLTILGYGLTSKSFPWIFAFHFNPYALTSLAALVTDLIICFLVVRIGAKTDDVYWLGANFAILAGVAVAETFCRLGATPATTAFWFPVSSMFTYFSPALFFMFALSYTHPNLSRHVGTIVTLLVAAISISFLDLTTGLFNDYKVILPTPWGGGNPTGPLYNILTVWVLVLYITSLVMMFHFSRRTLNPRLKRQSRIFYIACAIPIVFGTFTDGVLPGLGVQALPLGTLFVALAGAIITYGALRYRLLDLTPAVIAGSILDTINEAVIGIAGDFSIHYVNRGAERMLGYNSSDFAKLRFSQFVSQEWTEEKLRADLIEPLSVQSVVVLDDIDLHTATGVLVTAKVSVSPVTPGNPGDGYLIVLTDITKLARTTEIIEHEVEVRTRELEEAKATLVTSINSIEFGFIITDSSAHVVRVNTVAHELLCHSREHTAGECQVVTLDLMQNLFGSKLDIKQEINVCLRRQLPHEIKDIRFHDRDWRVYLSPMVVDRGSIGCAVLLQDITNELVVERSRDEFFSIASHELLTPLTIVKGYASVIQERYAKLLKDAELKSMVDAIYGSSTRLISIVGDFLYMSRLEHNQLSYQMEALSVGSVLEEVTHELALSFEQKGLYIKLGAELTGRSQLPTVLADKDRLKQIMVNLLSNAVKFTDQGGISIAAQASRSFIELTITDTGHGIPPKYQHLLFRKFQQATENMLTHDSAQGTGLGLYISRLLAETMGGKLELTKSVPGQGTVFTLSLPIALPARLKRLAATQAKVASK
jgi:PAS domain S-box-containing protein